jgi:hypothetical protein
VLLSDPAEGEDGFLYSLFENKQLGNSMLAASSFEASLPSTVQFLGRNRRHP